MLGRRLVTYLALVVLAAVLAPGLVSAASALNPGSGQLASLTDESGVSRAAVARVLARWGWDDRLQGGDR